MFKQQEVEHFGQWSGGKHEVHMYSVCVCVRAYVDMWVCVCTCVRACVDVCVVHTHTAVPLVCINIILISHDLVRILDYLEAMRMCLPWIYT